MCKNTLPFDFRFFLLCYKTENKEVKMCGGRLTIEVIPESIHGRISGSLWCYKASIFFTKKASIVRTIATFPCCKAMPNKKKKEVKAPLSSGRWELSILPSSVQLCVTSTCPKLHP